jgi:hypothetical protein
LHQTIATDLPKEWQGGPKIGRQSLKQWQPSNQIQTAPKFATGAKTHQTCRSAGWVYLLAVGAGVTVEKQICAQWWIPISKQERARIAQIKGVAPQ